MRWTGYIARIGEKRNAYKNFGRKSLRGYLGVGGRILLKWILNTKDMRVCMIFLAQDNDQCQALVNTAVDLP
jgi:hypothetical protein